MSARDNGAIIRSRHKSTKNLGSYVSNTLKDLGDKSPLLGWVSDMYSMAAKAQRNFSKVFSMGSKAMSGGGKGKKKAVKVAVQNHLASKAGVVISTGESASHWQASSHRTQVAASSAQMLINQEEEYDVPEFVLPYEISEVHPLTAEFTDETYRWLARHNIDTQVGPKAWKKFMEEEIPGLAGHVYVDTQPKEFLWCCKYVALVVILDNVLDEPEVIDDPNKAATLILELNKVLMWFFSEDPHLRQYLKPLFNCVSADQRDDVVNSFSKSLAYAYTSSRSGLMGLKLQPISSAFRDLWLEYCESLPHECGLRMARYIQNYLLGCISEAKNRKSQAFPTTLVDYIPLRRQSVGMEPLIVVTDLFVKARQWPEIPNYVFYGPHMQRLLRALSDVAAWHNDVYSFPKVLKRGHPHNLVFVISQEHGCSYMEAAIHAMEMINNRINDLETAAAYLQVEAPYSSQNAVAEYTRICRQWVTGSHQWHQKSNRYNEDHRII
ncbi:hypothetical protein Mapa_002142 [Marchantia paleacea]|nr:hypothetical protein Mapa_002142 [Marchantia paleacea]